MSRPDPKYSKYFFIIFILFLAAMIFVWEQIESERMRYKLRRVNREKQIELRKKTELLILCNRLKSPEKLYKIAKEYNLVLPSKKDIVEIVVHEEE